MSPYEFPLGDSLVLVRSDSPQLHILNASAALAWRLLHSGNSAADAATEFSLHFDIPKETAEHDLAVAWKSWEQTLFAPASAPVPCPAQLSLPPIPPHEGFCQDFRLQDRHIRVILHHPELIAEITPRLEPLLASPSSHPDATLQVTASNDAYHVFSGTACVASEGHPADARVAFLHEFVRSAHSSPEWAAILHAGACGTEHGCVIFPAETHSGKTTLAAACMHAGLTFYGDDSIPLEARSFTVPVVPFALMIREGSWPGISARFPEFERSPVHHRYGQNVRFLHPICPPHHTRARAAAIVFSQWQPRVTTTISSLDSFEALVRLKESGFWVAHDRATIQSFLDWLQSLPIYEMVYSDLNEATAFIRELVNA